MPSYIPDGYTQPGYIQAREFLHGPLRFKFRPARIKEVSDHFAKTDRMKGGESDVASAIWMKPRITEWNQRDEKGELLPIESVTLLKMNRLQFQQLLAIICGVQPTDLDPEWNEAEQVAMTEIYLGALEAEKTVGAHQEGIDAKNF